MQHKKHRGLGIKKVFLHNIALLAQWASITISNKESDWLTMFKALLSTLSWLGTRPRKSAHYLIEDFMLFNKPRSFKQCTYTKRLWKGWEHLRGFLHFPLDQSYIPGNWIIQDLLSTIPLLNFPPVDHQLQLLDTLHKLGIQ